MKLPESVKRTLFVFKLNGNPNALSLSQATEDDWLKARRQLEDRIRKDRYALLKALSAIN